MNMRQVINKQLSNDFITLEEIDREANKESGAYLSISKTDVLSILCDHIYGEYIWAGIGNTKLILPRNYFQASSEPSAVDAIRRELESGATVYRFDHIRDLFSYILIHKASFTR